MYTYVTLSPCSVNSSSSSDCLDHLSAMFSFCHHIYKFRQLHSSYFMYMYLIHPFFSLVVLFSFHLRMPASFFFPVHLISKHVQRILASFLALFVEAFLLLLFQTPCVHFH